MFDMPKIRTVQLSQCGAIGHSCTLCIMHFERTCSILGIWNTLFNMPKNYHQWQHQYSQGGGCLAKRLGKVA